jgi:competence protein ComEC
VRSPGITVIIAYYFGLLALLGGRFRFLTVAAAIVISIPLYREATTTTVTLLPGSGAIFADAPWSKNDVLVDCGRDYEMATRIKPFLRSRGVDRLNAVVLTHGDVAHVDGYPRLDREFKPRITYTSGARSRSPKYRQIVRELEAAPHRWRVVAAGNEVCGWRVLHPGANEDFSRADDETLVLSTVLAGKTVVLLSELGRGGQQALLNRGGDLKSDAVFAGVPTDGESLRPALMEALQPKVLVVAGNDARVLREIRELRTRATNVIAATEERAITLTVHGKKVVVETMTGRRFEIR